MFEFLFKDFKLVKKTLLKKFSFLKNKDIKKIYKLYKNSKKHKKYPNSFYIYFLLKEIDREKDLEFKILQYYITNKINLSFEELHFDYGSINSNIDKKNYRDLNETFKMFEPFHLNILLVDLPLTQDKLKYKIDKSNKTVAKSYRLTKGITLRDDFQFNFYTNILLSMENLDNNSYIDLIKKVENEHSNTYSSKSGFDSGGSYSSFDSSSCSSGGE